MKEGDESPREALRKRVTSFINHPITELIVLLLILLSVLLVLVEFSLDHEDPLFHQIELINHGFTVVFILELGLRYFSEKRKIRFFRRFWIDIIAVIPFFRSFRILRVFRLLRLFRFGIIASRRLSRLSGSFSSIKTEYIIIGLAILVVVLMGAFSMRFAEGRNNADFDTIEKALWFSVLTVIGGEPIGGDPKSPLGLMITLTLMMGGLTVFAIFTGTVSAVMVNSLRNLSFRTMEIDEIENHIVICGWNRAGELLLDELIHDKKTLGGFKHIVVVTEIQGLQQQPFFQAHVDNLFLLTGDYTRIDVLREAGITRAKFAMLLADDSKEERSSQDRDARTVLAAMLIEKLNQDIYTVVQLLNRDNETSLIQVGVEEIIVSDEYVGNIMATVAKNRGIVSMLDELLTAKRGHQFFKCSVPESMVGQNVGEVVSRLKLEHNATLIAVDLQSGTRMVESVQVNPEASLVLEAKHKLIIAAANPLPES